MNIPKRLQSKLQYCPRGGQEGLFVTITQLDGFSALLKTKFRDQVIPLNRTEQPLPKDCPSCHNANGVEVDNVVYWETEAGSHGWCCATCGTVVQWG